MQADIKLRNLERILRQDPQALSLSEEMVNRAFLFCSKLESFCNKRSVEEPELLIDADNSGGLLLQWWGKKNKKLSLFLTNSESEFIRIQNSVLSRGILVNTESVLFQFKWLID